MPSCANQCTAEMDFVRDASNRVTIQQMTQAVDAYGSPVNNWIDIADVWAVIEPMRASEVLRFKSLQANITHKVKIRYRADMIPPDTARLRRLKFGDRLFGIEGCINPKEENILLELACSEGGATV